MPDLPDQIICKLQQENKKLKKTLKQKDEELNRERQLWNNRETGWDPSTSTDLHRIEVFDGVISDESSLHSATLCSREEFRYILERTGACATASGDMPLFRDDESRTSDPGNRCKLRFRHALLMSLIRKKDNPTQGTLQAIFGIDQRHDPQLKIKSFSSNSYRSMFPNKQILRGYAENCAILCPSANYESSLRPACAGTSR